MNKEARLVARLLLDALNLARDHGINTSMANALIDEARLEDREVTEDELNALADKAQRRLDNFMVMIAESRASRGESMSGWREATVEEAIDERVAQLLRDAPATISRTANVWRPSKVLERQELFLRLLNEEDGIARAFLTKLDGPQKTEFLDLYGKHGNVTAARMGASEDIDERLAGVIA